MERDRKLVASRRGISMVPANLERPARLSAHRACAARTIAPIDRGGEIARDRRRRAIHKAGNCPGECTPGVRRTRHSAAMDRADAPNAAAIYLSKPELVVGPHRDSVYVSVWIARIDPLQSFSRNADSRQLGVAEVE